MADYFGKDIPKLGFGLMRLPKKGVIIDVEQTKQMVDMFIEAGFTYFDTAYVYLGSESATKKALVDRYPREAFTLASKLNAGVAPTEKFAKKEFFTSLERTGAGYFDYYLLHAFMENIRQIPPLGFRKGAEGKGTYKARRFLIPRGAEAARQASDRASRR